jgi:hypothetical protein
MGGGGARARPRGLSAVTSSRKVPHARRGKAMGTRAKGVSVGPVTVIVAASSKLPGIGGWRHKPKKGASRRNMVALHRAVGSVRTAVRQLERAGMILGTVAAGMELVREIRFASSNEAPSRGGETPARSSRSPSGGKASVGSSGSRSGKAATKGRNASKKTRGSRTGGTERSRPRAKTAGGTHRNAKKAARPRTSATRRSTSGRPRPSARK